MFARNHNPGNSFQIYFMSKPRRRCLVPTVYRSWCLRSTGTTFASLPAGVGAGADWKTRENMDSYWQLQILRSVMFPEFPGKEIAVIRFLQAFSLSWQFVAPWPFCLSKHRPWFKYFKKSRHQQDSAAIMEVWPAFQLPPASEASALLVLLTLAAKDRGREGWLQRPRDHKDSTKAQSRGCWGLLVSMYFYHIFIFICNWLRMNLLNSCWHHPTESAQSLSLRLGAFRCWRTGGRRGAPGDLAPCAAWELPRGRGQRRAAGAGLCRALGWRRRGLRRGIVSVSSRARDLVDERRLGAELRGSLPFVPGWGCVIWECRGRLMCLKCFEVAGCCRRFRVARVFLLAEKSRSRYSPNVSWGFALVSRRLVQSPNECPTPCAGRGIRAWLAETYLATTSVASCNLDPWECRIAWATRCARACKFSHTYTWTSSQDFWHLVVRADWKLARTLSSRDCSPLLTMSDGERVPESQDSGGRFWRHTTKRV